MVALAAFDVTLADFAAVALVDFAGEVAEEAVPEDLSADFLEEGMERNRHQRGAQEGA